MREPTTPTPAGTTTATGPAAPAATMDGLAERYGAPTAPTGPTAPPQRETITSPSTSHDASVDGDGELAGWLGLEHPSQGVVVATLTGDLDYANLTQLEHTLAGLAAEQPVHALVLDLTGVTFLALRAVAALVESAEQAETTGRECSIVAATTAVHRALTVTGADARLPCYTDRADALMAAECHARYRHARHTTPTSPRPPAA